MLVNMTLMFCLFLSFFDASCVSVMINCGGEKVSIVKRVCILWIGPHLVHGAEDMSIVLLEAADTGESSEGTRELVPVQDAEVGHANGQLSPGARPMIEHQTGAKERECKKYSSSLNVESHMRVHM